jgi:two-component system chemotaxis response regulator CheB
LLHGAVDAISRQDALKEDGDLLRRRVRVVSGVTVVRRSASHSLPSISNRPAATVVAIAASTGGPAALAAVLSRLAGLTVPVLVAQHFHNDFMAGFVDWLKNQTALPISLAVHGQIARPGEVYISPIGTHLRLGHGRSLLLDPRPNVIHRPSANELFLSVAAVAGQTGVGVVLTGMGDDGATGLLAMRRAGARTYVQDRDSCAVFGMPKAALMLGAVDRELPLDVLATAIRSATRGDGDE